MVYRRK